MADGRHHRDSTGPGAGYGTGYGTGYGAGYGAGQVADYDADRVPRLSAPSAVPPSWPPCRRPRLPRLRAGRSGSGPSPYPAVPGAGAASVHCG